MSGFILHLQDATQYERVESVKVFSAEDASGSFSLLSGHERFLTSLEFGLAHFCLRDDSRQYLAVPGAIVYFADNELFLSTRRYLKDPDYRRISDALEQQLRAEELDLHKTRESLRRMEEEMLRRLWQIGKRGESWVW